MTRPIWSAWRRGFGLPDGVLASAADLKRLPDELAALTGPLLVDVQIDGAVQNRAFHDIASRLRGDRA